jgi:hypothetical protein
MRIEPRPRALQHARRAVDPRRARVAPQLALASPASSASRDRAPWSDGRLGFSGRKPWETADFRSGGSRARSAANRPLRGRGVGSPHRIAAAEAAAAANTRAAHGTESPPIRENTAISSEIAA